MTLWQRLGGWTRLARPRSAETLLAEARSHVGHVRAANEDRFLMRSDRGLWAVADGMGGHGGGEAAASLAISALDDLADSGLPLTDDRILQTLGRTNELIRTLESKPGRISGTTIVAARRDGDDIVVYWAGDSRAYRISGDRAELMTRDHSIVQEMVDAGALSNTEAQDHPQAHLVTRALGARQKVEIDMRRIPFGPGDVVLLCSDGLSRSLAIRDLAAPLHPLASAADMLLTNALHRDGTDNATLVLIKREA